MITIHKARRKTIDPKIEPVTRNIFLQLTVHIFNILIILAVSYYAILTNDLFLDEELFYIIPFISCELYNKPSCFIILLDGSIHIKGPFKILQYLFQINVSRNALNECQTFTTVHLLHTDVDFLLKDVTLLELFFDLV